MHPIIDLSSYAQVHTSCKESQKRAFSHLSFILILTESMTSFSTVIDAHRPDR